MGADPFAAWRIEVTAAIAPDMTQCLRLRSPVRDPFRWITTILVLPWVYSDEDEIVG